MKYAIDKSWSTTNLLKHIKAGHCEEYFDNWVLLTLNPKPDDVEAARQEYLMGTLSQLQQPMLMDSFLTKICFAFQRTAQIFSLDLTQLLSLSPEKRG